MVYRAFLGANPSNVVNGYDQDVLTLSLPSTGYYFITATYWVAKQNVGTNELSCWVNGGNVPGYGGSSAALSNPLYSSVAPTNAGGFVSLAYPLEATSTTLSVRCTAVQSVSAGTFTLTATPIAAPAG